MNQLTPFFSWCRSRDLNPDERNSLPPQDSVSTKFHHFGIDSIIESEKDRYWLFPNTLPSALSTRNRVVPDADITLPSPEQLAQAAPPDLMPVLPAGPGLFAEVAPEGLSFPRLVGKRHP